MTGRKNWWVTTHWCGRDTTEEWLAEGHTEREITEILERLSGILDCRGAHVVDWSIREAVITIEVKDGIVQDVSGLPDGWLYEVKED